MTPMTGFNPDRQALGCCGAGCKEDCSCPPCPCNMDAWTKSEREAIAREKRMQALKGRAS